MKIRRIDFSPDEWLAGTASLSNDERGLYITACALIYSHGGPVRIDELRRHSHDHGNAFNRQLKRLLSLGKLLRNGREITNKRCENELEKAGKRVENGRESANKRWNNNGLREDMALLDSNANHQPSTINHQLKKDFRLNGVKEVDPGLPPESPWEQRCAGWVKNGFWQPLWGPQPGENGCGAPPEMVAATLEQRGGIVH